MNINNMIPGRSKNILRKFKLKNLTNNSSNDFEIIDVSILITNIINNPLKLSDVEKFHLDDKYINEINKQISKYLFNHAILKNDIIIETKDTKNDSQLLNFKLKNDYFAVFNKLKNKNIVSGALFTMYLQQLPDFEPDLNNSIFSSSIKVSDIFYRVGSLSNNNYYVDGYLKYSNSDILIFDNISFYDFSDYKLEYYNSPDIVPRYKMNFKIFIDKIILNELFYHHVKNFDLLDIF